MVNDNFQFSRDTLRRISGAAAGDNEYLRAYRDACAENISAGTHWVRSIADGGHPFDESLLSTLRAQLARVRFHVRALEEAVMQFKLKPELALLFSEAHKRALPLLDDALAQARYVEECFEPNAGQADRLSGYHA